MRKSGGKERKKDRLQGMGRIRVQKTEHERKIEQRKRGDERGKNGGKKESK